MVAWAAPACRSRQNGRSVCSSQGHPQTIPIRRAYVATSCTKQRESARVAVRHGPFTKGTAFTRVFMQ